MRVNGVLTWLLVDLNNPHPQSLSHTWEREAPRFLAQSEESRGANSTDYLYTGQRNEAETGLYFYKARFYDPTLGRFIQPDTLVPDPASSGAYDRYAYVNNNSITFNDPSGHMMTQGCDDGRSACSPSAKEKADYELFLKQSEAKACQAGNKIYCSYAEEHPIETALFGIVGLGVVGLSGPIIAGNVTLGPLAAYGTTATTIMETANAFCGGEKCASIVQEAEHAVTRVFWSGGNVAKMAAENWAKSNGSLTLEMTEAGRLLSEKTKGMDWSEARQLWAEASADFAAGAEGEVHAFLNGLGVDSESIWNTVEMPILQLNDNITRIIIHIVYPGGMN